MTNPQFDQQKQDPSRQQSQTGNLGQKEAKQEKKRKSDLSQMGDKSRQGSQDQKRG